MSFIQIKNLTKNYMNSGAKTPVLKGIDLEITAGQSVLILGASGAGKSTLLHIIGSLDSPSSGEVLIDGQNLFLKNEAQLCEYRNRDIGFVFQFHHLLPDFTALENVMMPLKIRKDFKAPQKAADWINRVGLQDRQSHKPHQLSGGEQQRVALARALIGSPRLILADEPTGNLDAQNGEKIFDLLLQLNKELGSTLVVVTHNQALTGRFDKTVWLLDGKVQI